MKEKFDSPKTQIVGMTQYYTHNFNDQLAPQYISTYDVSSCLVLLLKNIDPQKQCSAFGMAHLNLANVYFQQSAKQNLLKFISDFEDIGGNLSTASIQLLGGLIKDTNQVREKIMAILLEIGKEKGIGELLIKVPSNFKIDMSIESRNTGNGQKMTISCDRNGTYIRKVNFIAGKKVSQEFYPPDCQLLSDSNLKNIVPVDKNDYDRLLNKTNSFQIEVNKLVNSVLHPSSLEYKDRELMIHNSYCILEKVTYANAHTEKLLFKTTEVPMETKQELTGQKLIIKKPTDQEISLVFPELLGKIPSEIWLLIFQFLPKTPDEITIKARVCRSFYFVSLVNELWEGLIKDAMPNHTSSFNFFAKVIPYKNLYHDFVNDETRKLAKRELKSFALGYRHSKANYYNICIAGNNSIQLHDTIIAVCHGHPWSKYEITYWKEIAIRPFVLSKGVEGIDSDIVLIIAQTPEDLLTFNSSEKSVTKRKHFCVCMTNNESYNDIKFKAKQLVMPILELNPNDLFVNPNADGSMLIDPVRKYVANVMGKGVHNILDTLNNYIHNQLKLEDATSSAKLSSI